MDCVLDAFVLKHVIYLLLPDPGRRRLSAYVAKGMHNGGEVVEALDNGRVLTNPLAVISFTTPPPSRRVGAQTRERKENPAYFRGPQTPEHVASRAEAITNGPAVRRVRNAARGL